MRLPSAVPASDAAVGAKAVVCLATPQGPPDSVQGVGYAILMRIVPSSAIFDRCFRFAPPNAQRSRGNVLTAIWPRLTSALSNVSDRRHYDAQAGKHDSHRLVVPARTGIRAQESASSGIVGQVLDTTRGAMPGATVTVTNAGTNAQRVVMTDAEGRFTVPNLPPATYSIRVELSGFQIDRTQRLTLRNGEIARPTMTLGIASVSETVTVVGMSPLLQTTNASVESDDHAEADRGSAGRRAESAVVRLARRPGVTPQSFTRGTQFGAAGSSRSQYVTVEGGRDSSTNYAIDGVYVRSLRFNNLSLNPPLDAVQEVNVLRNAFTTEYGQGQAVVSIVTKSGSTGSPVPATTISATRASRQPTTSVRSPASAIRRASRPAARSSRTRSSCLAGMKGSERQRDGRCLRVCRAPRLLPADFSSLRDADHRSGHRTAVSRQRDSSSSRSRTSPRRSRQPSRSRTTTPRTTIGPSGNSPTTPIPPPCGAIRCCSKHNLFQRFMYYKGIQLNPGAFTYTNFPQNGQNFAAGDTWVISSRTSSTRSAFGYNYAYHLNAPVSLDGRNWVGDIGMKNLAGGTDPIDYGQSRFHDDRLQRRTARGPSRRARPKTSSAFRTPPAG